MMSNVIGPIDHPSWATMRQLRESVAWMKKENTDGRYSRSIDKEEFLYKHEFLKKLAKAS